MKRPLCFLVAAFSASLFCAGAAFAQDKPAAPPSATVQPDKKDVPKKDEPKKDEPKSEPVKPTTPAEEKKVPDHAYVKMSTSKGDIIIKLDGKNAPISTENFLKYVDEKFYDGTIFHRVIDGFMIQGGGFKPDMSQKPTRAPIKNEWKNGLKNKKGTLAMARTQVADSATSQFFINVKDNDMLDVARDGAAYAVFGEVAAGMDVVDKIRTVKTGNKGMHGDVPVETITINSVTKLTDEEAKKSGAK